MTQESLPVSQTESTNEYHVRRLQDADAPAVTQLVTTVYGHTYYPREFYYPAEIIRLNEEGKLLSIIALDAANQVVGHYALERPHGEAIAESSDAIVLPEHRHHHVMERMRDLLREEAIRLGLTGLVGYAVTNHFFSQKAEEHVNAHPCGLAMGLWPRTYHNLPEPLAQRMSFVVYFKYLRLPAKAVQADTPHQKLIARIYQQWGIPVEGLPRCSPAGVGELFTEYEPAVQVGTIRVSRVGADTDAAIRRASLDLLRQGAAAISLLLPLAQEATGAVCRAAEEVGFYFSGLLPAFATDGDVLVLQLTTEEIDTSLLQIENPFALEMLAYIRGERERIGGSRHLDAVLLP
jgi:hypothetical protein